MIDTEIFSRPFAAEERRQHGQPPELSVVMPCLNEVETLPMCISQIQATLLEHNIDAEIIVADNGSTDRSAEVAECMGARVVRVARRGYGSALMGGIDAARGRYIIMGDADCSYDFGDIPRFLEQLRAGNDLVMGNRFRGGIKPGAMPPLHKYLGNPVLTSIGRVFFKAPCGDFHCGLRGFSKAAYLRMGLNTTGMEFASEMVVKASLFRLRIGEVPTMLSPDRRNRPPHLRSWRDGWRHLQFLLLYSPRWLFLYPGLLLIMVGTITGLLLIGGPRTIFGIHFDVDTLVYAAVSVLLGMQSVVFATFTKVFAISEGLLPEDPRLKRLFATVRLETGLLIGGLLVVAGLAMSFLAVGSWAQSHFGSLDPARALRLVIPAAFCLAFGFETVLSSFFLSILRMKRRATDAVAQITSSENALDHRYATASNRRVPVAVD